MTASDLRPTLPARHKRVLCCAPGEGSTLDWTQAEVIAGTLRALSDPTRIQMLDLLVRHEGSLCVCDFIPLFAQHQPTISHHLRILREAGLVATEKQGIWAHYWATTLGKEALSAGLGLLEATSHPDPVAAGVETP